MRRHERVCTERIVEAAALLGDLANEVTFVGGAVVGLLLSDPASPDVRPTIDIDVVVEVTTRKAYYGFQDSLKAKGFVETPETGILCRWRNGSILIDVMPAEPSILGFTNIWYGEAARSSITRTLGGQLIRVISAPCFLATKLEAFYGRGEEDYMLSHDIEDIVSVLNGRKEVVQEIANSRGELQKYLVTQFAQLLSEQSFLESLPGHLPGDAANQKRLPIVKRRIHEIVALPDL